MPVITIDDVAYARFTAPDLSRMRTFLSAFGLSATVDGVHELFMTGAGADPVLHVTELGPPAFAGIGLRARSVEDVRHLADVNGTEVEAATTPGGGLLTRLKDPNGFRVDVIAGQQSRERRLLQPRSGWNAADHVGRGSASKRVPTGPSTVMRLGHVVLFVDDLADSWNWWRDQFGLLVSDEVRDDDGQPVGLFIRCDRGDRPADHHSLNLATVPDRGAGFHHAAFEVLDLDDLMTGHDHLAAAGFDHLWGIGRHILGSQVFDYWLDPWGNRIEHWTDGDMRTAGDATEVTDLATMLGHQWGPAVPANFV
jgi:catechol 2,3-dioxygenase-like lactoylglutathione lyase family enzyme